MINATPTVSPAALYLANLSSGSQGMRQPLEIIAKMFNAIYDADSCPWHELTYRDAMAVRQALIARYKPSTVNKMLPATWSPRSAARSPSTGHKKRPCVPTCGARSNACCASTAIRPTSEPKPSTPC